MNASPYRPETAGASLRHAHRRFVDFIFATLTGLALWCAHFGRAQTYDGKLYPPMNTAFEFLFSYGRELAIACMVACVIIYVAFYHTIPIRNFRGGAAWLIILNVYLTAKLLFYGNMQFALEAYTVIALTAVCMVMILPSVEGRSAFHSGSRASMLIMAIWLFVFLLSSTNLVALLVHPDSALNSNGRLHGTTVNPQHLAMMCALGLPGAAYVIVKSGPLSVSGLLSATIIGIIFVIEYMTGSRMGFAAATIGLMVALREYITGRKAVAGLFAGGLLLSIAYFAYGQEISSLISDRFIEGREDTRSAGWAQTWEAFVANPVFGVEPHTESGRLLFVENFWLAAISTGGIIALFISIPIFRYLVEFLLRFLAAIRSGFIQNSYGNFYLAVLAVLLGVSVFEAALLGVVATHTMLAYIYFAAAGRTVMAVERARRIRRYASGQETPDSMNIVR